MLGGPLATLDNGFYIKKVMPRNPVGPPDHGFYIKSDAQEPNWAPGAHTWAPGATQKIKAKN